MFPIRYDMSIEEVCTAALSYFDRTRESFRSISVRAIEDQTFLNNDVLSSVIQWLSHGDDDVQDCLSYFRNWLRGHVDQDLKTFQSTSGEIIDCSGYILSRVFSCEAEDYFVSESTSESESDTNSANRYRHERTRAHV